MLMEKQMKKEKKRIGYSFRKNNKKGDFSLDMIMLVLIIFMVSIAWIFIHNSFSDINTDIQSTSDMSTDAKASLDNVYNSYRGDFDSSVVFLFFGLAIMLMVSAWFIDTHPVFFVISLLLFIVVAFVTVIFANTFEEIVTDPTISSTASEWVLSIWVMSHVVELIVGVAFLVIVIMYGKYKQ